MTFEEAIAYTETLLSRDDLDDVHLEIEVSKLVQTSNGARGFFVCFLTGGWKLADMPSAGIVRALQSSPDQIAELLVKNLAMSTAMAIFHKRAENMEQAQGSDRVAKRTTLLIEKVYLAEVYKIATQMQKSATSDNGEYSSFLGKWGYDTVKKQAIVKVLSNLLANV